MITPDKDVLGKDVRAMTAQNVCQGRGRVVAFCDSPMVLIEPEEGLHRSFWWQLDLCEEVK